MSAFTNISFNNMKQNQAMVPFRYTLLLFILGLLPGCSYTSKSATKMLLRSSQKPYDLVVVPGVPIENGKWSQIMKIRVFWAKYLYDRGIAKNIMFSGSAVYSPWIEAEAMALYAKALGIPAENIYTETKAEHSTENIYYSYHKARKMGFRSIALASDPFQTKLLKRFSRKKVSPDVELLPMIFDTLRNLQPPMYDPDIDLSTAYVAPFVSLPERESFRKRWRGTRGKNIDERLYR